MEDALDTFNPRSAIPAVLLVAVAWIIHFYAWYFKLNNITYGVYPGKWIGLVGILSGPFIHHDWKHLVNNSVPLLIGGWALRQFYKDISFKVFIYLYLVSGFWLWVIGRPSYHIGASGIVYGVVFFLLFSGLIRREKRVAGISLLMIFLYGSMIWGIFPMEETVSFEAHLCGALLGTILAMYYRNTGIQPKEYLWDEDENNNDHYMEENVS